MPPVDLSSASTRTPQSLVLMLVASRLGSICCVTPPPKGLTSHGYLSILNLNKFYAISGGVAWLIN